MSDWERRPQSEKPEKQEEKDEKERQEKSWEGGWRRDPLSGVAWAFILIWAGLVFLAQTNGLFRGFAGLSAWSLVFLGAGVILLLEAALRVLVPAYRRPITGTVIFGIILMAIGLGDLVSWNIIWPIIIIGIGVSLLLRAMTRGPR